MDLGCIVGQQQRRTDPGHPGPAVLALHTPADHAAQLLTDELRPVADPQHRDAEVVDARIERRGAVDVDTLRAPRQHDGGRLALGDLRGRDPVRDDLGVDLQLAYPAGDQLRVLGAEVDDENGGPAGVGVSGRDGVDVGLLRLTQGGES